MATMSRTPGFIALRCARMEGQANNKKKKTKKKNYDKNDNKNDSNNWLKG